MPGLRGSEAVGGDSASPGRVLLQRRSDEQLVALAAGGDKLAFEVLVRRYEAALQAFAARRMSRGRAEDAVQQALFSAWMALQRGAVVREPRPWLYQIVNNTTLRMLRTGGGEELELSESLQSLETTVESAERKAALRGTLSALLRLPHQQRVALVQTSVEGRSQSEVAAHLGVSDTAVRGLVYRARLGLRAAVGALSPWPALARLLRAGRGAAHADQLARPEAASGGETLALLAKGGAIALATGAVAIGGVSIHRVLVTSAGKGGQLRATASSARPRATGAARLHLAAFAAGGAGAGGRNRIMRGEPTRILPSGQLLVGGSRGQAGAPPASSPASGAPGTITVAGSTASGAAGARQPDAQAGSQDSIDRGAEAASPDEAGQHSGEPSRDQESPGEAEAPPQVAEGSGGEPPPGSEDAEAAQPASEPSSEPATSQTAAE